MQPPRLFQRFFRWFCHRNLRDPIEGDLVELYRERVRSSGKRKADAAFILDVLLLFRPGMIRPVEGFDHLNHYGMWKNYFNVGIRNILKYKGFSVVNIFGLALAMSVCLLIILMLADQMQYDRFHENGHRVYRILSDEENSKAPNSVTAFPVADALRADYTVVNESTRLIKGVGGDAIYGEKSMELRGYFAEPTFFNVFSFELEKGNAVTALMEPNTMVISHACALRLFNGEDPIGKTVEFADRGLPISGDGNDAQPTMWGTYTITGVLAEKRFKSHLVFDVLVSAASRKVLVGEKKLPDVTNAWNDYPCYTYVVLDERKSTSDLDAALRDLAARYYNAPDVPKGFTLIAQQLGDITPGILVRNAPNQSLPFVAYYFLSFLALVIMVSACLNYMSLSTARSLTRAKEIGIRKVTGALRKNLVYQFLGESVITSLLALTIAILMLMVVKPAFKALWINRYLNLDLQETPSVYLIFVGFALFIGIVSGFYPALKLSKYQPVAAMKNMESMRPGKLGTRKVLSVIQFVVSLFFITTSILIYKQFRHYMEFDYGFNPESIVNVALQGADYNKVATEFSTVAGVSGISGCDLVPAAGGNNGMEIKRSGSADEFTMSGILLTDENFIRNLGLVLVAGEDLIATSDSSSRFVVVNESAVKALGYQDATQIIGEGIETRHGKELLEVRGVVRDFRHKGLANSTDIGPLVLRNRPDAFQYANVRIEASDKAATLAMLQQRWKRIDPVHPLKYSFFSDQLATEHQVIFDVVSILGFMAVLAVVIACLGLLGMAMYTASRKRKEVGIRKVLGAADSGIALLLSREFLKVLVVSVCIGAPLSYLLNNLWLQNFPNRVSFGAGTVLLATSILLLLGLITIASQTIRASRSNPVEALKVE